MFFLTVSLSPIPRMLGRDANMQKLKCFVRPPTVQAREYFRGLNNYIEQGFGGAIQI